MGVSRKWACNHEIWSIYNAESKSFMHDMTQITKQMDPINKVFTLFWWGKIFTLMFTL